MGEERPKSAQIIQCLVEKPFTPLHLFDSEGNLHVKLLWGLSLSVAVLGGVLIGVAAIFSVLAGGGFQLPGLITSFAAFFIKGGSLTTAGTVTTVVSSVAVAPSVLGLLGMGVPYCLHFLSVVGSCSKKNSY